MNTQGLLAIKKHVRKKASLMLIGILSLFFIDQLFFVSHPVFVMMVSIVILSAIITRRLLLTQKDVLLQKKLTETHEIRPTKPEAQPQNHHPFSFGKKRNEICKKEARAFFTKGDIAFRQGDFLEAKKLFIQTLAREPDHLEANYKFGIIYMEENEPHKAEAIFKKLIELKECPEYLHILMQSLCQQKKYEKALPYCQKALEFEPKNVLHYIDAGHLYWKLGKKEEALECFAKASKLDPKNAECLSFLIEYHRERGDLHERQDLLRKMLFLRPHDTELKEEIRQMTKRYS